MRGDVELHIRTAQGIRAVKLSRLPGNRQVVFLKFQLPYIFPITGYYYFHAKNDGTWFYFMC